MDNVIAMPTNDMLPAGVGNPDGLILDMIRYADVVGQTFGGKGKNVLITHDGWPFFTKDGITVAKYLPRDDPAVNLLISAAENTVKEAGDGTTSTMLILAGLLKNLKHIDSPIAWVDKIIDYLMERNKKVEKAEELMKIGAIAAHDEVIGHMIAEMVWKLGPEGLIRSTDGHELKAEIQAGYETGTGVILPQFIDDTQSDRWMNVRRVGPVVQLQNPLILLIEEKLENYESLIPIWEAYANKMGNMLHRPLVMICGDVSDSALQFIRANFNNGRNPVPWYVVKSPDFGGRRYEMLKDIQYMTETPELYSRYDSIQLKDFSGEFGQADFMELGKDNCRIIPYKHVSLDDRREEIRNTEENEEFMRERLSKLSGGVGRIIIDSSSQAQRRNLILILDDTVNACQGALRLGYQQGGRQLYEDLKKNFPALKHVWNYVGSRLEYNKNALDSSLATTMVMRSAFGMADQLKHTTNVVKYFSPNKVGTGQGAVAQTTTTQRGFRPSTPY
jgi:chaperonin GroEL